MKLAEAVRLANTAPPADATELRVALVCGFEPMHLRTFVVAHLRTRLPALRVNVDTGLFGSVVENLRRSLQTERAARMLVLEWSDLDQRLGIREHGGWHPDQLADIVRTTTLALDDLFELAQRACESAPLVVSLPTLALPPLWYTPSDRCSPFEADLRAALAIFAAKVAHLTGARLSSTQSLDLRSPAGERRDVKSELRYGYPYHIGHTDVLAEMLAGAVAPKAPAKKGLVTDVDDTLWRGLVGEVGADAVTWSLDAHSAAHGLYQQTLASLAAAGTLVAIASRNDPALVAEALARPDLLVRIDQIHPVEVHWEPKSASVRRILEVWNVGADSIVFVDDNPLELAEVQAAFPEVDVLLFPTQDDAAVLELCARLRDLFAREVLTDEDRLRAESLRAAAELREVSSSDDGARIDDFLATIGGRVTFDWQTTADDARALELVNKTNQFNLNGRRVTDAEWNVSFDDPGRFLLVVSYEDKFGPLGRIAVVRGVRRGRTAHVDTWVMSCRAFSRRIEFHTLAALFETLGVDAVELDHAETSRNGPITEFLWVASGTGPSSPWPVGKDEFLLNCPQLHHQTIVLGHEREATHGRS